MALEQETPETLRAETLVRTPATGARKWLAIGTGVGIEISGAELRIIAVRVRPSGIQAIATTTIHGYAERPATEWGAEYAAFAKRAGVSGIPVTVVLPRADVIVRHLAMPGIADADLAAAVSYQIDSLHPWAEDEAISAWARMPGGAVLVGIARRDLVDHYANLFTEAGIRLARFTFSAAVLASAARILVTPPAEFIAFDIGNDGTREDWLEVYGESVAKPVFSCRWETAPDRAIALARSELRVGEDAPLPSFTELLPPVAGDAPYPLASAGAIVSACPRLSVDANLLPLDRRTQSSRLVYIPTVILAVLAAGAALLLALQPSWQDQRYLDRLNQEIRRVENDAAFAARYEAQAHAARERIALLDRYRARTKADADALRETTNLLAPPAWLQSFQLSRKEVFLQGETEQATGLLKLFDESPLFKDSSFSQTMTRSASGEQFVIRTAREGEGVSIEKGEAR
jgi:hypothetical protein